MVNLNIKNRVKNKTNNSFNTNNNVNSPNIQNEIDFENNNLKISKPQTSILSNDVNDGQIQQPYQQTIKQENIENLQESIDIDSEQRFILDDADDLDFNPFNPLIEPEDFEQAEVNFNSFKNEPQYYINNKNIQMPSADNAIRRLVNTELYTNLKQDVLNNLSNLLNKSFNIGTEKIKASSISKNVSNFEYYKTSLNEYYDVKFNVEVLEDGTKQLYNFEIIEQQEAIK
ncbi:MAG: hypothetical protein LBC92_05245 [Rickettsiales bacterium]|nr:hypothetical protein [Rickettsiales bacterium]